MEAKLFAGILLRSRNRREISIKRLKNSAALYVFDVFFFPFLSQIELTIRQSSRFIFS